MSYLEIQNAEVVSGNDKSQLLGGDCPGTNMWKDILETLQVETVVRVARNK